MFRVFVAAIVLALSVPIGAQQSGQTTPRGPGRGAGPGPMGGMRGQMDASHMADMEVFHFLLDNGKNIKRDVKFLDDGIDTLTESDVPEVAAKIKGHVASMYKRLEEGRPIHMRDPLFRELFSVAKQITMTMEPTEKGIRVKETSTDPAVVKLLHEHARTVNLFIQNGRSEMRKNHPVPR